MARPDRLRCKESVLQEIGSPLFKGAVVLDLGCGAGNLVKSMLEKGYDAYGADLAFKEGPYKDELLSAGRLKPLSLNPFKLPFPDNYFDLINTDQVLEHVQDHQSFFIEAARVLKPGAVSMNVFPPKHIPVEPHVYVPLASFFQANWWLYLWAFLGVRKSGQSGMPIGQIAKENKAYLNAKTCYLSTTELSEKIMASGLITEHHERAFLKHYSPASAKLMRIDKWLPVMPWLCRKFLAKVLILRKPKLRS